MPRVYHLWIRDILTPMTTRHKVIVWAWIAVVVAAGACPPWVQHGSPVGFHLIFAPPAHAMHVDQSRLMIEWFMATAVAAGFYFAPLNLGRSKNLKPYKGRMPTTDFRRMVGLAPDGKLGDVCFDCDPNNASANTKISAEILRHTPIGVSNDAKFPFLVELDNGNFAWLSTLDGAEHFRRTNSEMVKWTA
jgi:hypothetical protein